MNCPNTYTADLVAMGLVLLVLGLALAGLIFTGLRARKSAAGEALLEACAGDWDAVALAIENVRQENELVARGGFSNAEYSAMLERLVDTKDPRK